MAYRRKKNDVFWIDGKCYRVTFHREVVLCDKCDLTRKQCNDLKMPCRYYSIEHATLKRILKS